MLSDIKQYLKQCHRATIGDLSLHFDTPPEAVRGMLSQWIRKGRIVRIETGPGRCGGGCPACNRATPPEIYEWQQ
jgi:hypothetical protein